MDTRYRDGKNNDCCVFREEKGDVCSCVGGFVCLDKTSSVSGREYLRTILLVRMVAFGLLRARTMHAGPLSTLVSISHHTPPLDRRVTKYAGE